MILLSIVEVIMKKNELMYNSINSRYLVGDYNRAIKLNENLLKSIGNIDYALIFFKSAIQLSLISSNYKLYNNGYYSK